MVLDLDSNFSAVECGAMRTNVCLTLPDDLVNRLDALAQERSMPRSYVAQELLQAALSASRERERAAPPGRPSSKAARAHLREHARLSGFQPAEDSDG